MTSGRGAGDLQTCPNVNLWQMAVPIHNGPDPTPRVVTRGVGSGPKMSENAHY